MEGFTLFIAIIFVVFGVLQIILFFKVWGMTNNAERMERTMNILVKNSNITTKHMCREEYIKSCDYSLESKGITYVVEGDKVIFSDGVEGEVKQIKQSEYYSLCYFITDDNYKLIYDNEDCMCEALHEYLTTKNILENGLSQKLEYKPEQ